MSRTILIPTSWRRTLTFRRLRSCVRFAFTLLRLAHTACIKLGQMPVRALTSVDRRAAGWLVPARGPIAPIRRMLGAAALLPSKVYFGVLFARFRRAAADPLLPSQSFDPDHVLMLIGTLGPGGSERQLVETVLGLKRNGAGKIAVVCQFLEHESQRFFLRTLTDAGVEVAALGGVEDGVGWLDADVARRFRSVFRSMPWIGRDLRRYALELIRRRPGVLHLWLDETNCKAGLAAIAVGIPRIILSTRSVAPVHFALYQPYMRQAYRTVLRREGVSLLNNSAAGARDYARWLALEAPRIHVIHNGFDFGTFPAPTQLLRRRSELRSALGVPSDAFLVGGILRFTEEKRPALWIETALVLACCSASVHFLLIGDGPLRAALKQQVERAGVASRIHLPGHQRDVTSALAAMDVFLLTSRMEGLPNVLIEAQALGVPVVSTDAGGARETFLPGESGQLVPGNARAIAGAISELAADPQRRAAWGRTGVQQARARFSSTMMIERTRTLYRSRGSATSAGRRSE